ncbi:MAG: 50S ribosomal protein L25 [Bacteroidota bacterium]
MAEIALSAERRTVIGKGMGRIRREDLIPGVFYTRGEENIPIQVPATSLRPVVYTSEAHIIVLQLGDGTSRRCILRDVQYDPVTDRPIHFDLQGLRENEELTIEVPISLTGGTPAGVREGGTLQQMIYRLKISCLPKNIPEKIEVNVADLVINQTIHVSDLRVPDATILENEDTTVVAVLPPTLQKEEVPAEAAVAPETAEPEVVGKGKKAEGEEPAEGEKEKEKDREKKKGKEKE